jgi:HPr kinase/phosphorylase
VRELLATPGVSLELRLVAGGSGLDRPLRHPRVQKSGLALVGHYHGLVPARIQVLGETEMSYLDSVDAPTRSRAARGLFSLGLSCVVLTGGREPHAEMSDAAEATGTPLILTPSRSSRTINALHALLDERLAPQTDLHGVLVDVFGVGLLILGKSGIGKSESALELVMRGHRLVADDVVRCDWRPPNMVFGQPADLLRHHMEIRGLGILNVKDLFGVTSVRERKRIDIVVRLVEWDEQSNDRLGLEPKSLNILATPIRELTVPVRPARDMGSILEMAARNELLRRAGRNATQELLDRIDARIGPSVNPPFDPDRELESLASPTIDALDPPFAAFDRSSAQTGEATAERPSDTARSDESAAWVRLPRPDRGPNE